MSKKKKNITEYILETFKDLSCHTSIDGFNREFTLEEFLDWCDKKSEESINPPPEPS